MLTKNKQAKHHKCQRRKCMGKIRFVCHPLEPKRKPQTTHKHFQLKLGNANWNSIHSFPAAFDLTSFAWWQPNERGKYWSIILNGCVLTNRKYTLRKTNALKKDIWPTLFRYSTSIGHSIINVFYVDSFFFSAHFFKQMEQMKKRIKNGNAIKQHNAPDKLLRRKIDLIFKTSSMRNPSKCLRSGIEFESLKLICILVIYAQC